MHHRWIWLVALGLLGCRDRERDDRDESSSTAKPREGVASREPGDAVDDEGDLEVKLCDDHTTTTLPAGAPRDRATGEAVSAALMAQWQRQRPDNTWEQEIRQAHKLQPPADNRALLKGRPASTPSRGQSPQGQTYGRFTEEDLVAWSREAEKLALEGLRVFHDSEELGSTIAVSCDMCHPDAANTHPETYPKYQTQLGRVALLRDMINWCLEHPVRAAPLAPDDPRMRAMEAYILAQRKGAKLEYGRH